MFLLRCDITKKKQGLTNALRELTKADIAVEIVGTRVLLCDTNTVNLRKLCKKSKKVVLL